MNHEAFIYKIAAICIIFFASLVGVSIPIFGKKLPALQPESPTFYLMKAFAGGVILATAFIHVLPDAFEGLTSPSLEETPWEKFPFTGFFAMIAAIGTLMVDSTATAYFNKSQLENAEEEEGQVLQTDHATHSHGFVEPNPAGTQHLRHKVVSRVLELGIVVHSIIIGISLGTSGSPTTIRPLLGALTFHQFFEGMGLGGCIAQASESLVTTMTMVMFFSLTTPFGIAIGICISSVYQEHSPTALIIEGVSNASSAGILIYMSLVDLLAADFMSQKMQTNLKLRVGAYVFLLIGAGCMSFIAIWA